MALPSDFQFSQNNLQDYIDCPRRFELRHLQRLQWPAPQTEPIIEQERHIQQGQRFHRLVQQSLLGLPQDLLDAQAQDDPDLLRWWQNYTQFAPRDLPGRRYAEHFLSAPFAGSRLVAQYDLLVIQPGQQAVIIDWKTNRRLPRSSTLKVRMQSRIYPLLLILAGAQLNDRRPLAAEQIEMIYWFTDFPETPLRLTYSTAQYQQDTAELEKLIREIAQYPDDQPFPLTTHSERCQFCRYRSLCQRGERAGDWNAAEEENEPVVESGLDLDFDQIGEIAF